VESQRLGSLVVDEATFKSERDVVKEELRQSVLSQPYGRLFYLYLPQASYQVHPYKRPGIGSIEELDAATIDDVRAFHAAYYRPDNAALIVVGNFDDAQLDAWVDKYFGPLKRPAEPIKRVTAVEPPRTAPATFNGYGPNVPLPAILMTWHAPDAASADAPALTVLDAILSSGKSSRLYESLVYEQQVATDVFSDASLPQQPGLVMLGAILASGKTIEDGQKALRAEVARLRDAPPHGRRTLRSQERTGRRQAARPRETIDGRAFALGYALRTAGDAALANRELAELQAVTAQDVQRVAQKYLTDAGAMTILYRPDSARPAGEQDAAPKPPVVASAKYTGPIVTLAPEGQRQAPPPIGVPVAPNLPKPAEKTLPNGLKVIVAKSSDLPPGHRLAHRAHRRLGRSARPGRRHGHDRRHAHRGHQDPQRPGDRQPDRGPRRQSGLRRRPGILLGQPQRHARRPGPGHGNPRRRGAKPGLRPGGA
jgi:zinc protease